MRGVPSTESEREAVLISRKKSGKGKVGGEKRSLKGPGFDEDGKKSPLVPNVVKAAPVNVNCVRLDLQDYLVLGQYLVTECFSLHSKVGRGSRMNTRGLIRLTAHGAFNPRECSWGQLRKLELKTAMNCRYACNRGEPDYAQRLDRFFEDQ